MIYLFFILQIRQEKICTQIILVYHSHPYFPLIICFPISQDPSHLYSRCFTIQFSSYFPLIIRIPVPTFSDYHSHPYFSLIISSLFLADRSHPYSACALSFSSLFLIDHYHHDSFLLCHSHPYYLPFSPLIILIRIPSLLYRLGFFCRGLRNNFPDITMWTGKYSGYGLLLIVNPPIAKACDF
jgi:hypothetical protein